MSVWLTVPSARPVDQVEVWAQAWKERGYKIALWRDTGDGARDICAWSGYLIIGEYQGYAKAVNELVRTIVDTDPEAEWFVIGGDDVFPDPTHTAEEIAYQCRNHFAQGSRLADVGLGACDHPTATFGVMQPTGDRWGENPNHPNPAMRSAYIDRVCGSAWIGREFARRVNQGNGPLWPEYKHMFVDEELQHVAQKLGVLWQCRDLTQEHRHAGRVKNYTTDMIPEHLKKWTTGEEGRKHWQESEKLFKGRRDAGFPGSEPL